MAANPKTNAIQILNKLNDGAEVYVSTKTV